jgi:drug/metabolite transporter (DMT)-like permease
MTSTDARPYLWMLSGSFSFAVMAEFAHVLTRACDWQLVAIARAGLVAVFAAVIAVAAGAKLVFWPWRLWVRSVAGSCSMLFTFYAFSRLPAADVLTLTNTFPIWVALLSWPLYGRPPGVKIVGAIAVGVLGVALVEQPHLAGDDPEVRAGVASALVAALMTAVAMLGLHSLKGIDPRAIVVHFSAVATVVCTAAYLVGPVHRDPAGIADPGVLLQLAGMAVSATVGQLFITLAFGGGAPAKVSVVGLSQIVMGLAFDAVLWKREVNAVTLLGTALVIAPTAWLLLRPATRPGAAATGHDDAAQARVPK